MRLSRLAAEPGYNQARIADLEQLLSQPGYKELRPCSGCNACCNCSMKSTACTCMCGADCAIAPQALSIDPENHPIEEKIVALVFELNCFQVYTPYWSCEGHTFPNGDLFRIPQVWFYSRSLVYPQLLNDYLHELYCSKKIKYMWQVRFNWTDDSENLEAGFTLEPNLSDVKNPQLVFMQHDAKTISQNLQSGLRNMAIKYIGMLKGYGAAANS